MSAGHSLAATLVTEYGFERTIAGLVVAATAGFDDDGETNQRHTFTAVFITERKLHTNLSGQLAAIND